VIIYFTANDYFGNQVPRWVDYYHTVKNPCIDPVYVRIEKPTLPELDY